MSRTLSDALRWVETGTALTRSVLDGLDSDGALAAASALPGWTRKNLLGHVAANAEALANLVTWARTGIETPMYSSTGQRNADIEEAGRRTAADLTEWFQRSADALAAGFAALDEDAWASPVTTIQGRTLPVSETPWLRSREVMVHAVDFGTGLTFHDLPHDFLVALEEDIRGKRAASGQEVPDVTGAHPDVVAWLAGRDHGPLTHADGQPAADLPPWL